MGETLFSVLYVYHLILIKNKGKKVKLKFDDLHIINAC